MVREIGGDIDDIAPLERRRELANIVKSTINERSQLADLPAVCLPYGGRELSQCFGIRNGNGWSDIIVLSGIYLVVVTDRNYYDKAFQIAADLETRTGRPFTLLERYSKSQDDED